MKQVFLKFPFYPAYGAVESFAAFVDENDLVADLFYLLHTVGTENDSAAFFGQFMDFFFDEVAVDRVEPAEGFVEYDEFGFVEHGDDKL